MFYTHKRTRNAVLGAVLGAALLAGCAAQPGGAANTGSTAASGAAASGPAAQSGQLAQTAAPGSRPQRPERPQRPGSASQAQLPTAAQLGRDERCELVYQLEGMQERLPAVLYIGDGYSLYIPEQDWHYDRDWDDGVFEESWESRYNDDVELRVLRMDGMTLDQARSWLQWEEDDYRWQQDKAGNLFGEEYDDGRLEFMDAILYDAGGTVYAVVYSYPEQAAEGFGVTLQVLADTFALYS